MNDLQRSFLDRAAAEAEKVSHPFPAMAACEAALESSWANSELAREACNLFGMKEHKHPNPAYGVLNLPTREFVNSHWIQTTAEWVKYPDWASCFADRLSTLKRLASVLPHYAAALAATDPKNYVIQVSESWSTDPGWQCACGEQFLLEKEIDAHQSSAQHVGKTRVPGLGRALKVISIFEEYQKEAQS